MLASIGEKLSTTSNVPVVIVSLSLMLIGGFAIGAGLYTATLIVFLFLLCILACFPRSTTFIISKKCAEKAQNRFRLPSCGGSRL